MGMTRMAGRGWLLVLVLALGGCGLFRGQFADPEVAIAGLRMGQSEGLYQQVLIDLVIVNPNKRALALDAIGYRVRIEGHELVSGISRAPLLVEPGGTARYTVPASLSLFGGFNVIRDLMLNPKREGVTYELDAKLEPSSIWLPTIRVNKSETIPLAPPR